MRFKNSAEFSHARQDRIGVLLVNLGTPEAPDSDAVRRYLAEFLWDPRVVEIPRPLWWLILHGVILRTRPAKSAHSYKKIWTPEGSPLLLHSLAQRDRLREALGSGTLVEVAMRYGKPSMASALDRLCALGARRILVLPLYPQYSGATTGSAFDALAADFRRRRWLPDLRFITHYHDFAPYIDACCAAIEHHWLSHGRPDRLVLSYHGVPRRYLDAGDPYFCECQKTSRLIGEKLEFASDRIVTTFQSRFGKAEWLKPYTDKTLMTLPADGVKSVHVFCPGFSADCLETLEEIAVENRGYFLGTGGETFDYIPALNAGDAHISALKSLIDMNLQGWQTPATDPAREHRAKEFGAGF